MTVSQDGMVVDVVLVVEMVEPGQVEGGAVVEVVVVDVVVGLGIPQLFFSVGSLAFLHWARIAFHFFWQFFRSWL